MKYILMCIGLLAGTFIVSRIIIWGIYKWKQKKGKTLSRKKNVILTILLWILLVLICSLCYLGVYNHSEADAKDYLNDSETVAVNEFSKGYCFDGPGEDTALIFYPGAKVATEAYAPMLHHLAEQGIDAFLVDMPFHMAILNSDAAGEILDTYGSDAAGENADDFGSNHYETWILCGHSLGGTTAALYANSHPEQIDALVLLAAYPTGELDDDVALLSIYGSNDTVLNRESYEAGKTYWPDDAIEYCIEGGNHAQYGNYGEQKGDSEAEISAEEQQQETINAILELSIVE